jgi:hypothetical protein
MKRVYQSMRRLYQRLAAHCGRSEIAMAFADEWRSRAFCRLCDLRLLDIRSNLARRGAQSHRRCRTGGRAPTDEQGNNIFRPAEFEAKEGDVIRYTLVPGVHNAHFLPDSIRARPALRARSRSSNCERRRTM